MLKLEERGRGYSVFVTDENGNPIRHPIKMSDFQETARFYELKEKAEKIRHANAYTLDTSSKAIRNYQGNPRILVDLLRLIPNYLETNGFRKKKQLIKKRRIG